jgi:glucan endo-1,3-beta-D-glucosidase
VFVYDVRPEFAGRTCTLALYMPQLDFEIPQMAPVGVRARGGISVSRLVDAPGSDLNAQNVGNGSLVGIVPTVLPASQYNIASFPCEAGQRVGYQVDSISGLDMNWFQMTYPALGLFMQVD